MSIVANRYARAFADVIFDQKLDAAEVLQQLKVFVDLLHENDSLKKVWENPVIPAEQKRSLLDSIVARVNSPRPVRNFLAVLIDHHRIPQLDEIFRAIEHELHDRLGLAEAE